MTSKFIRTEPSG